MLIMKAFKHQLTQVVVGTLELSFIRARPGHSMEIVGRI